MNRQTSCGLLFILILGTLLSFFGRFSPWALRTNGTNAFHDGSNLALKQVTNNRGFFYVQLCDEGSGYCYTQSIEGRRADLSLVYSKTVSDIWMIRRVGGIVVESLATFFNVAGVFCVLMTCLRSTHKSYLVLELYTATFTLIAAVLQWSDVGVVYAEVGAYARFPVNGVTTLFPVSLLFATLGSFCLTVASIWYYVDIFKIMRKFNLSYYRPHGPNKHPSRRLTPNNFGNEGMFVYPPPPLPEPVSVIPRERVPPPPMPLVPSYMYADPYYARSRSYPNRWFNNFYWNEDKRKYPY